MDGNVNSKQIELQGKVVSIPRVDATLTKEGYAADAKATGEALQTRVKITDIVDGLASDATDKPLSAKQGKELRKQIADMSLSGAGGVSYDNSESGLSGATMQTAMDEVASIAKNAVSKNGGDMINGPVNVRHVVNGYSTLNKNHSEEADYGTQVVDRDAYDKTVFISLCAAYNTFTFTDRDGNVRDIHHEGNKPFIEYTGNGSADERTIQTKGFGRLAVLYCSTHCSLVTPKGAFVANLSNGSISWVDSGKLSFFNGNLVTGTANEMCNKADETYYLQVV